MCSFRRVNTRASGSSFSRRWHSACQSFVTTAVGKPTFWRHRLPAPWWRSTIPGRSTRQCEPCATLRSGARRFGAITSRGSRITSSAGAQSVTNSCSNAPCSADARRARTRRAPSMCGIAGIVGPTRELGEAMQRMLAALRHRGPDGEGIEQDAHAILGHRRLSIIDLAGGRQPLTNADRSIWLVCNGEIYNYRALRADLENRGQRFLTHSDCEVIIGLYELYGDRLLEHLRGMFSFALWDARQRRLLLARDHLGQKPLYYARTARGFAFASEIKALLAFDGTLRVLDLAALDQYLGLRLIAPPLSMFRGIHKLPPAHLLVLEAGGEPVISRFWSLSYQPKLEGSDEQLLDELEAKVDESLRLHLVSDVPVGALLSGG